MMMMMMMMMMMTMMLMMMSFFCLVHLLLSSDFTYIYTNLFIYKPYMIIYIFLESDFMALDFLKRC